VSLAPSLYCLYRRSRYSRSEYEQSAGLRQNRRELFAVAAVAFALKHDEKFRVHFLREICGFGAREIPSVPKIEVQPRDHSDMSITDEVTSSLFVVEFKVGAELEQKQNPGNAKAFFGNGGYGKLILEDSYYRNCTQKSYIVLDDSKDFEDGERQGLTYKSRTWADLDLEGETATGLWADLLDSLGDLGVATFQFQRLRNMNNAQYTKQAVAMHQTLATLASRWNFGNSGGEIDSEGDSAWYGCNIPNKTLLNFTQLEMCVQAQGKIMGWFGYQSWPEHCERAFQFNCGSDEAINFTQAFILERVRNGPPGESEIQGGRVLFKFDGYADVGDAEWFDNMFRALADKKIA
jgi:hypothetical protein